MKRNPLIIAIGVLLIVIFGLWLVMFQVRQSEVALVTTFGKPTRTLDQPGAYFKWPPPVQRVHRFDRRIQNFGDQFDQSQTSDGNVLLMMIYVGWRIEDAGAFYPKFASGTLAEEERGAIAAAENTLEGLLRSAKTAVIGKHPLADFASTDPGLLKFEAIENEILDIVRSDLRTNNYGIDVKYLGIKKLGLPESVTQEVFKKMASERQKLVRVIVDEGQKQAFYIRSGAEKTSRETITTAEAEATKIRGQGQAEAAQYFAVFQQNPDLANYLLDLYALEQVLKGRTTLIFDDKTPPFNSFQNQSAKPGGGK